MIEGGDEWLHRPCVANLPQRLGSVLLHMLGFPAFFVAQRLDQTLDIAFGLQFLNVWWSKERHFLVSFLFVCVRFV